MKEVEFIVEMLPEEASIRGNAVVIGDEDRDRLAEGEIISALADGNDWAWCRVKVTARVDGIEGTDYLGCCSYRDEEDFREGGCYEDMQGCALNELRDKLTDALYAVNKSLEEDDDE